MAGQSLAAALARRVGRRPLAVDAVPATELSGFGLADDMSDTLVVAISQSGTTTDTNRTVDLVRAAAALVIAMVNRRHSDLVDKADGVLYTSDGRDVEMSVASTKAFYAQVAAGFLLALAVADAAGASIRRVPSTSCSARCATCPSQMRCSLEPAGHRRGRRRGLAPRRRYWAVVGNGVEPDRGAEMRIKLSELCYKSIACDATEDKKHIDLSSEPLILVCAAGLTGSDRRRRGQGDRHLPGPQGGADRDRRRRRDDRFVGGRRRPSPCRPSTRRWLSCCRPWPATCSATRRRWPSTPRPDRCARPGPPSRRRRRRRRPTDRRRR